ncbi:hypothetical protein LINPERPRIM_LOCUS17698 [Linum perenne]
MYIMSGAMEWMLWHRQGRSSLVMAKVLECCFNLQRNFYLQFRRTEGSNNNSERRQSGGQQVLCICTFPAGFIIKKNNG